MTSKISTECGRQEDAIENKTVGEYDKHTDETLKKKEKN